MDIFSEAELRTSTPNQILDRLLSTRSCLQYLPDEENLHQAKFKQIGKGQCGTVFAQMDKAIKIPNSFDKLDELKQDAEIHGCVVEAFEGVSNINVPNFRAWVDKTSPFWTEHASYSTSVIGQSHGIVSDRIHPLPLPVRKAIIATFFRRRYGEPDSLEASDNQDCLIRLYLGRKRPYSRSKTVNLRNFPLYIDDMEKLGLDIRLYATSIAQALATMHWKAKIDANDVEFVLGGAPNSYGRSVDIWLLDFNKCSRARFDSEADVALKQLVDGYLWNDPYYPRPDDKKLWNVFSQHYIDASAAITDSDFPRRFITAVEEGNGRSVGNLFA